MPQRFVRAMGFLAVLCVAVGPARAQQLSQSEELLGGLTRVSDVAQYPAQLTIPEGWIPAFRKMVQRTQETGNEVSACLELTTPTDIEKGSEEAMTAYQSLLTRRSQMRAEDFKREEEALRKKVEASTGAGQGEAREWTVSPYRDGTKTSTASTTAPDNPTQCEGAFVGSVHTHPKGGASSLSDMDIYGFGGLTHGLAVVLHDEYMCAVIKGNRASVKELRRDTFSRYLTTVLSAGPMHDNTLRQTMWRHGALIAQELGAVEYCGEIGQPLARQTPLEVDANNPILVLAVKAWLIGEKNLSPKAFGRIDFPLTAEVDDQFKRFLSASFGADFATNAVKGTPLALLTAVLDRAPHGKTADYGTSGDGFFLPNNRLVPVTQREVFGCTDDASLTCMLLDQRLVNGKWESRLAASYQGGKGFSTVITSDPEHPGSYVALRRLLGDTPATIKGPVRYDDSKMGYEITGAGSIETQAYYYEGDLVNSSAEGRGRVKKNDTGRWYRATAKEGSISYGEELK
ncbi:hypothetical protein [Ralstonia insidiosa]|uniref:hypothetical protein n=1 Tax=Ralstonia insidiosa TaxID=190721 RepID=UPI001427A734|nr:hypothetical protein [Ralstonia insidiosa]